MTMDVFAGCNVKWVEWFKFHWVQELTWTRGLYGLLYAWIIVCMDSVALQSYLGTYLGIGWGGIGYRF